MATSPGLVLIAEARRGGQKNDSFCGSNTCTVVDLTLDQLGAACSERWGQFQNCSKWKKDLNVGGG